MRAFRTVLVLLVLGPLLAPLPAWALEGELPVQGRVVRPFQPPAEVWGAGHRGVDLAAAVGTDVVSPADGTVTWAGLIAGRPVLVVSHGEVRSTFEPVDAVVAVGQRVVRGQVIGRLVVGHACPAPSCLHWGLRRGPDYLDPLSLVEALRIRLLPDDAIVGVRERAALRAAAEVFPAGSTVGGAGVLSRPVDAPVTSRFGPRVHPIFGDLRLHAGVDLSAPCGTPIRAAADGVVSHVGFDASGGWRLVVSHGTVQGAALQTTYLHAQGYGVRSGQSVVRGQVVGTVGSTGWSTGCHLHFSVKADGRQVDPEGWW